MKMHSDICHIQRLLQIGAIFFFTCGNTLMLYADECSRIFEKNKEKILASRYFSSDGYIFAVGKMISRSRNKGIGFSKSKLDAINNFSYFLETKIDWPQNIHPSLRKRIIAEYLKCVTLYMTLSKTEIIYREAQGDRYTVVLGIPERDITASPIAFSELRKTLLNPQHYQSGKLNLSICIELCNGNPPQMLLEAYADKLGKEYGSNVKRMLSKQNAVSFACRPQIELANKSLHDLLILLNSSPYDPELCFHIGNKLANSYHLKHTAEIYFELGTIAGKISPVFAEKCREKITSTPSTAIPVLPEILILKNSDNINFTDPNLVFLNRFAGMVPVGVPEPPQDEHFKAGQQAFASNQLHAAYDHFVKSVAAKVTFSGCNMAGNAGRRIGKYHEAIALLLQAAIADKSIVYPWVHLVWIYRELGLTEQENYCIKKIGTYKLDNWSSNQLSLLKAKKNRDK